MPIALVKRNRNRGFTLIELLVVVAILGIIGGIAYPAYMRVRNQAKALFCIQNLRQIGLAFGSYAGDNDGRFPPPVDLAVPTTSGSDADPTDHEEGAWSRVLVDKGYLHEPTSPKENIFLCPFDEDGEEQEEGGEAANWVRSYAYNPGRSDADPTAADNNAPVNRLMVSDPQSTILLAEWYGKDPSAPDGPSWESDYKPTRVSGGIYAHHNNGKSGVLFYDLHAEEVSAVKEIPDTGAASANGTALKWTLTPQ